MYLADVGLQDCEHVQLLADSHQPVFMQTLTPAAEALVRSGLLRSCSVYRPDSKRAWFILETTDKGRLFVSGWIAEHNKTIYLSSRTA
jgi:hypothetical protein